MDYPEEVNEGTPYGSEGLSLLPKEVVILSEIWRNYRPGIMSWTINRGAENTFVHWGRLQQIFNVMGHDRNISTFFFY